MDKDAYYFPHFSNARSDRKILRLRKELQIEGYGIYFMLLEVLRDTPNYNYPMEDIDLLAAEFNTSEQKVRTVICNYGLFEVDENENFFSVKFNEYLQPYLRMKEQRKIAGQISAEKRRLKLTTVQQPFNDRSTVAQQSKVKESKVKESKEDIVSRKQKFAHTLEPYLEKYGRDMLNDFYSYWTEPNKSNTLFRQEQQKAWDLGRRLATWAKNDKNFKNGTYQQTSKPTTRSQQNSESVNYLLNSLAEDMQRIGNQANRTEI